MNKLDNFLQEKLEEIKSISVKNEKGSSELEDIIENSKSELKSLYTHRYLFVTDGQVPEWFAKLKSYFNQINKKNLKIEDGIILNQLKNIKYDTYQMWNLFIQYVRYYFKSIVISLPILYFLDQFLIIHNHMVLFLAFNLILFILKINNPPLRSLVLYVGGTCIVMFYQPLISDLPKDIIHIIKYLNSLLEEQTFIMKIIYLEITAVVYCIISAIIETKYALINGKFEFFYDWAKNIKNF